MVEHGKNKCAPPRPRNRAARAPAMWASTHPRGEPCVSPRDPAASVPSPARCPWRPATARSGSWPASPARWSTSQTKHALAGRPTGIGRRRSSTFPDTGPSTRARKRPCSVRNATFNTVLGAAPQQEWTARNLARKQTMLARVWMGHPHLAFFFHAHVDALAVATPATRLGWSHRGCSGIGAWGHSFMAPAR